jgi:hypothetical protein
MNSEFERLIKAAFESPALANHAWPLLRVTLLRVVDPLLGRVDVDHSPDESSCEHLPQRLRRLKAVPGATVIRHAAIS